MLPNLLDVAFESTDAMPDLPPVHFQLGLTRTARPDATAKSRQIFAITGQSCQPVFELRKLDLQLAFFGSRSTRENVEDKSGAIDDFSFEDFLQVLRLARRQFIIEDDDINALEKHFIA